MERGEIAKYVPDASVAVKWFVEERDSSNALRLKQLFESGRIDLEAPSLLWYELASAIRFHPKAQLTLRQLSMVTEALGDMQITREPTQTEWRAAFRLASENPISIYGAIYIGVAVVGGSKMVTSDTSLLEKLKSRQAGEKILPLRDVTP